MYLCLSHKLTLKDSAFPGAPTMKLFPFEVIGEEGAACNTYRIELFNHFGTHMDGPEHFAPGKKQLWEMELETFISESPLLLDIPKGEGEGVLPEDLLPFDEALKKADMLFIRSGFESVRYSDNSRYSARGPSVSAAAARLIVDRWPNLKAIGLDWISATSPLNIEDGIKAHQTLLGYHGDKPVLIIEDIALSRVGKGTLEKVFVMPLMVEGIDSAPVTILAQLAD